MTLRISKIVLSLALVLLPLPAWTQMAPLPAPLTGVYLQKWLTDFDAKSSLGPKGDVNLDLVSRVRELRNSLQTNADISTFRNWEYDDKIVERLVPLAAGPRSELRVPATLILADIVDNTNVCYLIAYLAKTPDIGADGQFNLLQVTNQVAKTPYQETGMWISNIVDLKASQIKNLKYYENTSALLERTKASLRTSSIYGSLKKENPDRYVKCLEALPADIADVGPNFPEEIDSLTVDIARQRLFSDQRQDYAAYLAKLYADADPAGQKTLVDLVVASIIPQKTDPERRYRVNLYVAVTLGKMGQGALKDPIQKKALLDLKQTPEYTDDVTFKNNVDFAISRQGA